MPSDLRCKTLQIQQRPALSRNERLPYSRCDGEAVFRKDFPPSFPIALRSARFPPYFKRQVRLRLWVPFSSLCSVAYALLLNTKRTAKVLKLRFPGGGRSCFHLMS